MLILKGKKLEFGSFQLDVDNQQLLKENEPVEIQRKSFQILSFLVENNQRIVTKEELIDLFWQGKFVEETSLTQQIYQIRKTLKDNKFDEPYIKTHSKQGYKFTAKILTSENNLRSKQNISVNHLAGNKNNLAKPSSEANTDKTQTKKNISIIDPSLDRKMRLILIFGMQIILSLLIYLTILR